jgi:hypothetical protein
MREKLAFSLNQLFDFFRITWKVTIEPVDQIQLSQALGPDNAFSACRNLYRFLWKHPVFAEIKDPEGHSLWRVKNWESFDLYFDMDEIEKRTGPNAKLNGEARVTVHLNQISFDLGCTFEK